MIYLWGRKAKLKGLGEVADFCIICRRFTRQRVFPVSTHDYYHGLTITGGRLIGHVGRCADCGVRMQLEIAAFRNIATENIEDFDELLAQTHPNAYERYEARLSAEARAKIGLLSTDERMYMMREPLLFLNAPLESRARYTWTKRRQG